MTLPWRPVFGRAEERDVFLQVGVRDFSVQWCRAFFAMMVENVPLSQTEHVLS